jgi:hypothetical protein
MLLYPIRSHSSSNSYNQKIDATLTMVWFGHHSKHTILIVSYSLKLPTNDSRRLYGVDGYPTGND